MIEYGDTRIINAFERYTLEIPDRIINEKDRGQVIYKTRRKAPEEDYSNMFEKG